MTEAELFQRKMILSMRADELHAMIHVYLVEFPFPQYHYCGTPFTFAFTTFRATDTVRDNPHRAWISGKHIDEIKKWVWTYRGRIMCDSDPSLRSPSMQDGTFQRWPIKKLVYKEIVK